MLINNKPVEWESPLTKWFNNDLIAPKKRRIEVVKYVRCINPFGETVYVSEIDIKSCEELGLSMRRIQ